MSVRTPMSPDALSRAPPTAYKTSPRMGGYLRTMVSPNNAVQSSISPAGFPGSSLRPRNSENVSQGPNTGTPNQATQTTSKTATNQPGQNEGRALAWDGTGADETPGFIGTLTPDNCFVLSMTVSTIMALAAGGAKVPDSHLSSTSTYLESIKNDDEELPINIKGIKKIVDQANPTKLS